MTLIVDVDLDLLKGLHNYGSVRNLKDRRTDLYELKLKPQVKVAPAEETTSPNQLEEAVAETGG